VIDTHAHLDACDLPADELVERGRAAGVERIVTIGSGVESCRASLAIAVRQPGVVAALGIHPHQAGEASATDLDELRELLESPEAVAVGETGLDYYRDYAPRARQLDLFQAQISIAVELRRPLVVHTRAAEDDTFRALEAMPDDLPVVLHCFSSASLLAPALERGYYVSFAGNVTYPNAADLRRAAAAVPASRILAETDSPYLSPQHLRGRPNEPANVVQVLAGLAEARAEESSELESAIDANAARVFGPG
jgi:TatD DNase family protein